jgi:hypothetical protein
VMGSAGLNAATVRVTALKDPDTYTAQAIQLATAVSTTVPGSGTSSNWRAPPNGCPCDGHRRALEPKKTSRRRDVGWTGRVPVRSILCQTVEFRLNSIKHGFREEDSEIGAMLAPIPDKQQKNFPVPK